MSSSSSPITPGAFANVGKLARFAAEPKSGLGITFSKVLGGVGSLVNKAVNAASSVITGGSGVGTGLDPQYQTLIETQIQVQEQMMLMSFYSNIEKSKHETKMAAVRNVRVG